MFTIAVPTLLMVPATLFICGLKNTEKNTSVKPKMENAGISDLFKRAFKNRSYIFIVLGFFTCGFHMALITNHLPTQITSYGMSSDTTAAIFSVYGVATMIGAFLVGIMCSKFKMKNVLGTLYGSRTVMIILFFIMPKTVPVITAYVLLLGFTGASTVSPVSGICGELFGPRGLSILFNLAFLVHQFGSFLSAWLGGICFDAFGSYNAIWIIDAAFCILASSISYMIREKSD